MREIKFRAYVPDIQKNVDVFAVNPMNQTLYLSHVQLFGTPGDDILMKFGGETDQVKLREYIGIKDKNGLEIYEGDIIKYYSTWGSQLDEDEIDEDFEGYSQSVNWDKVSGGFSPFATIHSDANIHFVEVIGNIYENPELLKGE